MYSNRSTFRNHREEVEETQFPAWDYQQSSADAQEPNLCTICSNRTVVYGTACCSKRCEWFATQRCPQCSRFRDPNFTFCSYSCSGQSHQANWCHVCGVRQIVPGTDRCGFLSCQLVASNYGGRRPHHSRWLLHDVATRHTWSAAGDKQRTNITSALAKVGRVLGVIRFNGDVGPKKRYLSYRAGVEQVMTATRAQKYGHGGEGNEHRRFFPVPLTCTGITQMLITNPAAADDENAVMTCSDPACTVCSILINGMSLEQQHIPFHFSTSSAESCIKYCAPMQYTASLSNESDALAGEERFIAAFVIARAVVGVPHFNGRNDSSLSEGQTESEASLESTPFESPKASFGAIQSLSTMTHCHVEVKSDGSDEITFRRDDAVDPMSMVFVEYM